MNRNKLNINKRFMCVYSQIKDNSVNVWKTLIKRQISLSENTTHSNNSCEKDEENTRPDVSTVTWVAAYSVGTTLLYKTTHLVYKLNP